MFFDWVLVILVQLIYMTDAHFKCNCINYKFSKLSLSYSKDSENEVNANDWRFILSHPAMFAVLPILLFKSTKIAFTSRLSPVVGANNEIKMAVEVM
jgi:hypothetical protein